MFLPNVLMIWWSFILYVQHLLQLFANYWKPLFKRITLLWSRILSLNCRKNYVSHILPKKVLGLGGPYSSVYKRRKYFKEHFQYVEPVAYILNSQEALSFQYVPVHQTLQCLFDILHEVLKKKIQAHQFSMSHFKMGNISSKTHFLMLKNQESH